MKLIKILIIIIIFNIFCLNVLKSQSNNKFVITGTILSKNKPLEFCNILFVSKSDSSKVFGTISNSEGIYSIKLNQGEYIQTVSLLGYNAENQVLSISSDTTLANISLQESAVELDEFVVVEKRIKREADRFVIDLAGSSLSKGKTALEALKYAPGVWTNNGISINGKANTKLMVNSKLMNIGSEEIQLYLENLSAEDILKIEVIPESGADFDANLTGGIIHIITKKLVNEKLYGYALFNIEHSEILRQTKPLFNIKYRKNKLSLYSSIYYKYNNYLLNVDEKTEFKELNHIVSTESQTEIKDKSYGGGLGMLYSITDNSEIGIDLYTDFNDKKPNSNSNSVLNNNSELLKMNGEYDQIIASKQLYTTLYYSCVLNSGSVLNIISDYIKNADDNLGTNNLNYQNLNYTDVYYKNNIKSLTDIFTLSTNYETLILKKINSNFGMKYTKSLRNNTLIYDELSGLTPSNFINDNYIYDENIAALYANCNSSFGLWQIKLGMRYEYSNINPQSQNLPSLTKKQIYSGFFPSANINYIFDQNKGNFLIFNYNRKIQRPGYSALNPFTIPVNDFTYTKGNPKLSPSFFNNYTVSFVLHNLYSITMGMRINNNAIYKIAVKDEQNPEIICLQERNINNSGSYFSVLSLRQNVTDWWKFNCNFFVQYSEYDYSEELNKSSKLQFQSAIQNTFNLPAGIIIDLGGNYISAGIQGNMYYDPVYAINIDLTKAFFNNKLRLVFSANNLFTPAMTGYYKDSSFYKTAITRGSDNELYALLTIRYSFNYGKGKKIKTFGTGNQDEKNRL